MGMFLLLTNSKKSLVLVKNYINPYDAIVVAIVGALCVAIPLLIAKITDKLLSGIDGMSFYEAKFIGKGIAIVAGIMTVSVFFFSVFAVFQYCLDTLSMFPAIFITTISSTSAAVGYSTMTTGLLSALQTGGMAALAGPPGVVVVGSVFGLIGLGVCCKIAYDRFKQNPPTPNAQYGIGTAFVLKVGAIMGF